MYIIIIFCFIRVNCGIKVSTYNSRDVHSEFNSLFGRMAAHKLLYYLVGRKVPEDAVKVAKMGFNNQGVYKFILSNKSTSYHSIGRVVFHVGESKITNASE